MDTIFNKLWDNALVEGQTQTHKTHLSTRIVNDFYKLNLVAAIAGHSWLINLHSFTKQKMKSSICLI